MASESYNYARTLRKLSRKSAWPAVCLMFASIAAIVVLVFVIVSFFTSFIINLKLQHLSENSSRVETVYHIKNASQGTPSEIVAELAQYLDTGEQICVVDRTNRVVASSGAVYPDFSTGLTLNHGSGYEFYQDRVGINLVGREDFEINLYEIVAATAKSFTSDRGEWMNHDVLRAACWFGYPLDDGSGYLYVREIFLIQVQETWYISLIAIIVMIILSVLVCLLFINFINNIVNQKRLVNQLYTDIESGGKSWTYFIVQATRVLQKRRNRRKNFAVVSLHLSKYHDYCACYGMASGIDIIKAVDAYFNIRMDNDEVYARHSMADFALLLKFTDKETFIRRLSTYIADLSGIRPEQRFEFTAGAYIVEAEGTGSRKELGTLISSDRKTIRVEQLYNYAYEAAQHATETGFEHVQIFSSGLVDNQMWERKIEDTMEQALRAGEFVVYYQPKYNPNTNKLVAAEALIRWNSPTEGMIGPNRFIPLFEKNGFITKIDDYMFASVAKQQAEWKLSGKKTVPVSVNLSRIHFAQEDLARNITSIVDSYGVDHKLIEIEITESAFVDSMDSLLGTINELRSSGFVISMDDFGSIYSSLNTLKELPLDIIKIDRGFFVGEGYDGKGKLIVSSVIRLAKSLKMKVVAEGVELEEQIDFLAKENCDMIQGYYYAKPMPAEDFEAMVARDA